MKKIIIIVTFLLAVLASFGIANAFEVSGSTYEQTVCPSETALFTLSVKNTGASDSFTVSLSDQASKWAVAAPSGFSLNSGATESVYLYVTPPVSALEGTYDLKISVSSELAGTKEIIVSINVESCHGAILSAGITEKEICSATLAEYDLVLQNIGKFSEAYELSITGNAKDWSTLSDDYVSLKAGEAKTIKAFATPPADQTGNFVLTVLAKSLDSDTLVSKTLTLKSNSCYDYDLLLDKNYISFCENSEVKIPVTIRNSGTADNVFNLKVDGPSWAKIENENLAVSAESSRETFLVLFPGYDVQGNFKIIVSALSDLGDTAIEQEVTADVNLCHTVDLKISDSKDTLCPFNSKFYEISIVNPGEYTKSYALKVFGADWAELDKNFIELSPGETAKLNLKVDPKNIPAGRYVLKITAESQDDAHTEDSDILEIYIATSETCFGVNVLPALTRVEVVSGEGSLVPVIIENKGSETSTYTLDVSGTGASYAQFNPATITLGGGEAKTAYMYVSVPEKTPQIDYKITISAKLEDGTISSSKTVDMAVLPAAEPVFTSEKVSALKAKLILAKNKIKAPFIGLGSKIKAAALTVKNKITSFSMPEFNLPSFGEKEEEIVEITEEEPEEEEGFAQYLSEKAKGLLSKDEVVEEEPIKEENKTILPSIGLKDKVTGFTSAASDKFSGAGSKIKDAFSGLKNKITSIGFGDLGTKFKSALGKGKIFMLATTYFVPNWIWLIGLIFILAAISFMLRKEDETEKLIKETSPEPDIAKQSLTDVPPEQKKKGIWKRFVDFLEEDEEVKEEPEVPEVKPEEPAPTAQEILEEADKIMEEPKPKPKRKIVRRKVKKKPKKKITKKIKKTKKKVKPKRKRKRKVIISEERLIREED